VKFRIDLSSRAVRDLDRLGRDTQERMMKRLEQLAGDPSTLACPGH
jgi:mRNA-degrading endonuclease RelE of RelBE toxin-antitoxin system